MKTKTIAAAIVEAGPGVYGQSNYDAAVAALAAGCPTEVEAEPVFDAPYVEGEELDLSLLE